MTGPPQGLSQTSTQGHPHSTLEEAPKMLAATTSRDKEAPGTADRRQVPVPGQ